MTSDAATRTFEVVRTGGVPFCATSLPEAARWLVDVAAVKNLPVNVRLANAYNVALASSDGDYRRLLVDAGVNFPDGTPVVWFMKAKSRSVGAQRVRGPSLFAETLRAGVAASTRHFLLGSTPDTLSRLETALHRSMPGVRIAGRYSPPFAVIDDAFIADCVDKVSTTDANLVWLGLGTPKQDILGTALSERLGMTTVNVGAAFDFVAGTVREAPPWIQRSGFEWLYRLAAEPRRLWRRYLFGNARFLAVATGDLVRSARRGTVA